MWKNIFKLASMTQMLKNLHSFSDLYILLSSYWYCSRQSPCNRPILQPKSFPQASLANVISSNPISQPIIKNNMPQHSWALLGHLSHSAPNILNIPVSLGHSLHRTLPSADIQRYLIDLVHQEPSLVKQISLKTSPSPSQPSSLAPFNPHFSPGLQSLYTTLPAAGRGRSRI